MSDIAQAFDGPVIEAVKGIGDVKFPRADMEYWSTWANALKGKRVAKMKSDIDASPLGSLAKVQAKAQAENIQVQFAEVLDLQYTPDGIKKILLDSYIRGGGEGAKWPEVSRRIGPGRQQSLASEICSEPKPTIMELRDALREMLRKAKRSDAGVATMSDDDLVAAVREFEMPEQKGGEEQSPLAGSADSKSNLTTETNLETAAT